MDAYIYPEGPHFLLFILCFKMVLVSNGSEDDMGECSDLQSTSFGL